jgi:hypothetical protein
VKHFLKYFLASLVLATACDSDEPKPVDIGVDYFPLQTGNSYTYDIDETIYSEVAPVKNLVYQLRIEITDSFPNAEGDYTYVLHRSTRNDVNSAWEDLDTWSVRGNDREIILNEGNIPYLKLTFPLKAGNSWNGNKYNNLEADQYEVTAMDQPFVVSGTTFDKTLSVLQENNEDFIVFQDKREEVYARDVGLIYKETIQLSYCTTNDCVGQQKIKSGTIYKQQIAEYVVQ